MIVRRVVVSIVVGCALSFGFLILAWFNQSAAIALVPGARLIVAVNNVVRLSQSLNIVLLVVLNGLLWGGILLAVWTRASRRRAETDVA
jgi:hypothetical protein